MTWPSAAYFLAARTAGQRQSALAAATAAARAAWHVSPLLPARPAAASSGCRRSPGRRAPALADDPVATHQFAAFDRLHRRLAVGAGDPHEAALLVLHDRRLRHEESLGCPPARRTRTNWPGSSASAGFGNSARSWIVPSFWSTVEPVKLSRPDCGYTVPSPSTSLRFGFLRFAHLAIVALRRRRSAPRSDLLRDRRQQRALGVRRRRGCHRAQRASGDAADRRVDVVYDRLSCASLTRDCAAAIVASAVWMFDVASSYSRWLIARSSTSDFEPAALAPRLLQPRALLRERRLRLRQRDLERRALDLEQRRAGLDPLAFAYTAASRGCPDTRARTSTSFEPSAWPTDSSTSGMRCVLATTTVTGIAGGGPPAGAAAAAGGVSGALLHAASSSAATMRCNSRARHDVAALRQRHGCRELARRIL